MLGLSKLMLANKISRPEQFLCRMIAVLYKSFEYTDTKREDFHVKIYEIMSSFIYFYVNSGKAATKSLINSILIIFLSQIMGQSNFDYKSVFTEFQETKLEFINQFLKMICESDQDPKKPRKILFRIFKYIYFLAEFVQDETDIENIDKSLQDISFKSKRGKGNKNSNKKPNRNNLNKMDIVENNNNNNIDENESYEEAENSSQVNNNNNETEAGKALKNQGAEVKKIKIPIKIIQNIKGNIKKFLEKTKYDAQLFSDLTDEKFLKLTTMLNNCNFIGYFSSEAQEQFNEIKENEFKIDRNGIEIDLKERMENFSNYVESKREKYFGLLNTFFAFEEVVKRENIGAIIEENSLMIDDEEDNVMNAVAVNNNNITNVINHNNKRKMKANARKSAKDSENNNNKILDDIENDENESGEQSYNNINININKRRSENSNASNNNNTRRKDNKRGKIMKQVLFNDRFLFIFFL